MSNVWGTKYRLLVEQLEQWVDRFIAEEPVESVVLEEQTVRLLMGVVRLLEQHQVNKRGQCKFCGWTRWKWRSWRRRRRCRVFQILDFAMCQNLDVVWWELLAATGAEASLAEVREWVEEKAPDTEQ